MSHAERDNAISHYCRGLCTYGRRTGFLAISGSFVFALVFILEVRLLWSVL